MHCLWILLKTPHMLYSTSTMMKIITVQGLSTPPCIQKLPEHSLKRIKWPAMKSSKDVVDQANALLNTAAGGWNPQPRLVSYCREASGDNLLLSRLCGPGPSLCSCGSPDVCPQLGRACLSQLPLPGSFHSPRRKQRRGVFSRRGINTWEAQ